MGNFTVELVACISGNPLKAWHGTTGDDDKVHVPDDEWQDQSHDFDDLDAAKSFIEGLPEQTTTHVVLVHHGDDGDEVLYRQDAGHDDLEAAAPGVVPWSEQPVVTEQDDEVPDAPPLLPRQ